MSAKFPGGGGGAGSFLAGSLKRSNLNELKFDVKFRGIEAEDFQATFNILLA